MTRFIFAAFLCLLTAHRASAQVTFALENTTLTPGTGEKVLQALYPALAGKGYGAQLESDLAPVVQTLVGQLQSDVAARIAALQFQPFIKHMALAGAGAIRGPGIDPASRADVFSLSVEGAVGSHGLSQPGQISDLSSKLQGGEVPSFGIGADGAITVGLNLGAFFAANGRFWDPARLTIYGSGMRLNLNLQSQATKAQFLRWGAHAKYKIVLPRAFAGGLVRANGVDVALGFTFSQQQLQIAATLPSGQESQQTTVVGQPVTSTINYAGAALIDSSMRYYTIPIEVVSSIQFLHAVTLFGGLAADLNLGSAALTATATEPAQVVLSNAQGKGVTVLTPAAVLNADLIARPSAVDGRAFLGLQVGVAPIAVFGQVSADTSKTLAADAGVRIFW